jgi:hypothetical protein
LNFHWNFYLNWNLNSYLCFWEVTPFGFSFAIAIVIAIAIAIDVVDVYVYPIDA